MAASWRSKSANEVREASQFTTPREAMDDAITRIVVEDLRRRGFTGSLPHFRRRDSDHISLLSVQHFSSGGSFVVEVAICPSGGHSNPRGGHISPAKVRAVDINGPRPRLGSENFPEHGDHWFAYGPRSYEVGGHDVQPSQHYENVAMTVVRLLDTQAEPFWRAPRA